MGGFGQRSVIATFGNVRLAVCKASVAPVQRNTFSRHAKARFGPGSFRNTPENKTDETVLDRACEGAFDGNRAAKRVSSGACLFVSLLLPTQPRGS